MFDISWAKLLIIAVVALIFIGPKELPELLHTLGKTVGKLRRSADDFRRQFEDSMHEAGYKDLHKNLQDFRHLNPASQLKSTIEKALLAEPTQHTAAEHQAEAAHSDATPGVMTEKAAGDDTGSEPGVATSPAVHLNGAQHPKPAEPFPGNPV